MSTTLGPAHEAHLTKNANSCKRFSQRVYVRFRLGSNKGYKIYKVLRYLNLSLENFEFAQNAINKSITYINYFKSASVKLIKS